jgi:hypothetical protein
MQPYTECYGTQGTGRERDAQHEAKIHFNILIFHKQSIFKLIDLKTKNKD